MKFRKKNPFKQNLQLHARALSGDHKLRVVWKELPPGMGAGYDFISNQIIMPQINIIELNEDEVSNLIALSYHERKHHALSSFEPVKKAGGFEVDKNGKITTLPVDPKDKGIRPGEMLKTMLNFLEDCRIELNEHYILPGYYEYFMHYRKGKCREKNFEHWGIGQYINPWGCLMVALQYNLCDYAETTVEVIPELKEYYDDAWEILQDGRFHKSLSVKKEGTETMLTLAKEILEKWKIKAKADPNMVTVKMEAQGMSNDMQGGSEKSEQGEKSKGKAKKGERGEPTDEEGDESGEGYDIEEEFKEGQEKEDGKYAVNPNQLNSDMADLAREKVDESTKKAMKDKGKAERGGKDENEDESTRKVRRRHRMDKVQHVNYVPYDVLDRTWIAKAFPEAYAEIRAKIADKIAFARRALTKALLCLSQDEIHSGLKTGRLDQRRLAKLSIGSDRVFWKKRDGIKLKSAVQLVIDLSGSMQSGTGHGVTRAMLAAQVATLFGECLQTLKVPFEIIGFNTSPMRSSEEAETAKESGCARTGDIVNRWVFKYFDENFLMVRDCLGACEYEMGGSGGFSGSHNNERGCVGGCNVDHEVILWGAARLFKQVANRRIQIVLSDGLPSGYEHDYGGLLPEMLLQTVRKIERSGIELYAFGMDSDAVEQFYTHYKVIHNLSEMNEEALRFLASSFKYQPRR